VCDCAAIASEAMDSSDGKAMFVCCGCLILIVFLLLSTSIKTVAPTEMAIKYNWITCSLAPDVISTPGMSFQGFWTVLYKYPKTIQTVVYDDRHRDLIDGRTRDGLSIMVGLTFQYRLLPDKLHQLYADFESEHGEYRKVFQLMGMHLITEKATHYEAKDFFNKKASIANEMRLHMDAKFQKDLYATVTQLQITEDDLPGPFYDAVIRVSTMEQNVTKAKSKLQALEVKMRTDVNISEAMANVTLHNAQGEVWKRKADGEATAGQIRSYVGAEKEAYKNISTALKIQGEDLIKYIWYDTVGGGNIISPGSGFSVFSGINPGAYIQK
jgi:hypothetical protein